MIHCSGIQSKSHALEVQGVLLIIQRFGLTVLSVPAMSKDIIYLHYVDQMLNIMWGHRIHWLFTVYQCLLMYFHCQFVVCVQL